MLLLPTKYILYLMLRGSERRSSQAATECSGVDGCSKELIKNKTQTNIY